MEIEWMRDAATFSIVITGLDPVIHALPVGLATKT